MISIITFSSFFPFDCFYCLNLNLNLNSLLVKRQIDNPSPGAVTGGNKSLALTREVNLDTLY